MPIFITTILKYDVNELKKSIQRVLPTKFISVNDIKTTEDLNQSVFMGEVFSWTFGLHTVKGRYCKVILSDLLTDGKASNCFDVKIACYIFLSVHTVFRIKKGNYVAVSKADVVAVPAYYNILNQHSRAIVCENISTDEKDLTKPFLWIMTNNNPSDDLDEAKPSTSTSITTLANPSPKFKTLKNLKHGDECYIFAVVMDMKPVSQTKRLSYVWVLFIRDESYDECDNFCLNVFFPKGADLPVINFGDIIRCRVQADLFNDRINAKVFNGLACMFFPCCIGSSVIPTPQRKDVNLSADEQTTIEKLREWTCSEFTHYLFVSDKDGRPPRALRLIPLSCISAKDQYFDLFCEVHKVIPCSATSTELLVIDRFTSGMGETNFVLPDVVSVYVYGKHSSTARRFKTGDVILMRNVFNNIDFATDDCLNCNLEFTDVYHDYRLLVKCNFVQTTYLKKKLQSVIKKRPQGCVDEKNEPTAKRSKLLIDENELPCTPVIPGRCCELLDSPLCTFTSTQTQESVIDVVGTDGEFNIDRLLELEKAMQIDNEISREKHSNSSNSLDQHVNNIVTNGEKSNDEDKIKQHEGVLSSGTEQENETNAESQHDLSDCVENHSETDQVVPDGIECQSKSQKDVRCEQNGDCYSELLEDVAQVHSDTENHSDGEYERLLSPPRLSNWIYIIRSNSTDHLNTSLMTRSETDRNVRTVLDSEIVIDNVGGNDTEKNIELIDLTEDSS